jgi:hypothetical protein
MVTIYTFGYLAGRFPNTRTYLLPISCIPVVVGALVIWQADWTHRAAPLIGYYLLASFGAPYVLLLSLSAANTAGGTKKSVAASACFLGYNVGNIGPSLPGPLSSPICPRPDNIPLSAGQSARTSSSRPRRPSSTARPGSPSSSSWSSPQPSRSSSASTSCARTVGATPSPLAPPGHRQPHSPTQRATSTVTRMAHRTTRASLRTIVPTGQTRPSDTRFEPGDFAGAWAAPFNRGRTR